MAFDVTPTSGASPYEYSASFVNGKNIDDTHYVLEFRNSTAVGSCPVSGSGADQPGVAESILATGSFVQLGNSVPSGSCRTSSLVIIDLSTGSVIDESAINIDNT